AGRQLLGRQRPAAERKRHPVAADRFVPRGRVERFEQFGPARRTDTLDHLSMISALTTDLYQLTMAAGYWRAGLLEPATFELFVRRLPDRRSFLVAAGLDEALAYLESLRFSDAERDWLRALPQFADVPRRFFDDYLRSFRFTGGVWAMPEGTPAFAGEPL